MRLPEEINIQQKISYWIPILRSSSRSGAIRSLQQNG